jgi:hypothetical protein
MISALRLRNVGDEVNEVFGFEASEKEATMTPDEKERDQEKRQQLVRRLKFAAGVDIGLGVIFMGCALLVSRAPVIATVTGLTLHLGTTAVVAAINPAVLARGIVGRVIIILCLVAAVKAAISVESRRRAKRRREKENRLEA